MLEPAAHVNLSTLPLLQVFKTAPSVANTEKAVTQKCYAIVPLLTLAIQVVSSCSCTCNGLLDSLAVQFWDGCMGDLQYNVHGTVSATCQVSSDIHVHTDL